MGDKHVAVIGAGAAGLAATSYLLAEGLHVTLFEERSEPGGVWTNTDTATRPNPIYSNLETNVPRTLMAFTDHPWQQNALVFPPERTVARYLKSYYDEIEGNQQTRGNFICMFNTTVHKLQHGTSNYQPRWKIEARTRNGESFHLNFHAVVVAAGKYEGPYTPTAEPGRQLWECRYPGTILHPQQYQEPEKFRTRCIVVNLRSSDRSTRVTRRSRPSWRFLVRDTCALNIAIYMLSHAFLILPLDRATLVAGIWTSFGWKQKEKGMFGSR